MLVHGSPAAVIAVFGAGAGGDPAIQERFDLTIGGLWIFAAKRRRRATPVAQIERVPTSMAQ
jgi:hypothetical protein